jgi:hypothetical protein
MVSPAGFRFAGGNCCCCWDYFCQTSATGYQPGYRRLKLKGEDYPSNDIDIDEKTVAGRPPDSASLVLNTFRPDYRNKKTFFIASLFPRLDQLHSTIMRSDFTLAKKERIAEFSVSFLPASGTNPGVASALTSAQIACNYVSQRVIYTKTASATVIDPFGGPLYEAEQEIRSVKYDGSDDTLLHTETFQTVSGTSSGIGEIVFEPKNNRLYYGFRRNVKYSADTNTFSYIKHIDAEDGTGETTIVTLEDTTNGAGDYILSGPTISGRREKVIWGQRWAFDNTHRIWRCGFDGEDPEVMFDPGAAALLIQHPRYNERDDYVTYERLASSPTRTLVRQVDWDGSNDRTIWDTRQGDFFREVNFAVNPCGHYYGCGKEITGEKYHGAG